jgi:hypothetical protein
MVTFCGEDCKELFNIVSAYNMKLIGKAKVQAFVAEHGITDFQKFDDSIRKVLESAVVSVVAPKSVIEESTVSVNVPNPIREEPQEKDETNRSRLRSSLRRRRKHNF